MSARVRVVKGRYVDSVVLMRLAEHLTQLTGVEDAAALMGTAANKKLLREGGFVDEVPAAGSDDLIVAVKADDADHADEALARLDELLGETTASPARRSARTLEDALELDPDINIAAISLPGEYAAEEARGALERGLHVFLFSSNVTLEDEIALKTLAAERGLLCMGPDCGTALIAGKALGFGNAVRRGPVGVVAAAGSGLQAVTSYLDGFGVGVHMPSAVEAATSARPSVRKRCSPGSTRCLQTTRPRPCSFSSKPPSVTVAAGLHARAAAAGKPVHLLLPRRERPETLDDAARAIASAVGAPPPAAAPASMSRRSTCS